MTNRMRMHNPAHPGEVLADTVLAEDGLSVSEFARRLGVSRVALSRVVNGRAAISADMALRLQAALGGTAESWLHMQASYDLWKASQRKQPLNVERIRARGTGLRPQATSAGANPAARRFIASDGRAGDVARDSKRLLRERFRGK
jgi:addiction module HigA family antidote